MQQRAITVVLLVGLFFGLITLVSGMSTWRLPDDQQGYTPVQPIDYSHRLHAGELQIDCKFCHSAAEHSRHAGVPASKRKWVKKRMEKREGGEVMGSRREGNQILHVAEKEEERD